MAPNVYITRLTQEHLTSLRQLIGQPLLELFSSAIVVDGPRVTAWDIQIHLHGLDRWIIFRCDWLETPKGELDYFQLHVSESQGPLNIEVRNGGLLHASSVVV